MSKATTQLKLEKQYEHIQEARDDRSFFTHLYNYVQIICRDKELENTAWQLYANEYAVDHADDENKLDVQAILSGGLEQSTALTTILMLSVQNDHQSISRIYYAWQTLFTFYNIRSIKPELLKSFHQERYKKYRTGSPELAQQLDKELDSVFNVTDTSDNIFVRQDNLSLCLEVFHPAFIELLNEPHSQEPEAESVIKTEVKLFFDGNYPKVSVPSTGKDYSYHHMVAGKPPFQIIKHCYDNPNVSIEKDDLPANIHLGDKGLIASLRGTKFYPDENGALSIFLLIPKNRQSITLYRTKLLTKTELEELLSKSSD